MALPVLIACLATNLPAQVNLTEEELRSVAALQERVYVTTDRPYYYPGETVWYRAFLSYAAPGLRDTLSRVLYVEWMDESGKVLTLHRVRISQGAAFGGFDLPGQVSPGLYVLRAYTAWSRNFGYPVFSRTVPVLELSQNVDPAQVDGADFSSPYLVDIAPRKPEYSSREWVSLRVTVSDKSGKPVKGDFAVSVVDEDVAVRLPALRTILSGALAIESRPILNSLEFAIERGITVKGTALDYRKKPAPLTVNAVQGQLDNYFSFVAGADGRFVIPDLIFDDSVDFAFQATNSKGKPSGHVTLDTFESPRFTGADPLPALPMIRLDAAQRIQNTYQSEEQVTVLEGVEVSAQRLLSQDERVRRVKVYGDPDYTVRGDQIVNTSATNVLQALQGKVPGLQIIPVGNGGFTAKVRGGTSSMGGSSTPLILVDGVPWDDISSLGAINPAFVDRVEVVTRAVNTFGARGTNGVIAIYTKSGDYTPSEYDKTTDHFRIAGYTPQPSFRSPDHSQVPSSERPDFRNTIYWNPRVVLPDGQAADVSFYAADLETTYRVDVEGITDRGIPFKAEYRITVRK
jgi:hypothetical protein